MATSINDMRQLVQIGSFLAQMVFGLLLVSAFSRMLSDSPSRRKR